MILQIPQTEEEKRNVYFVAFGKQFDSPDRKQLPLPIDIACLVAMHKLTTGENYIFI